MKLGHIHLKVRELDRSIAFYRRHFGLELTERAHGYAFLTDGGAHHTLALREMGHLAPHAAPHAVGLYHVAFEVENIEALASAITKLQDDGIRPIEVDHGISRAIYFTDPDGNGLEIYVDTRTLPGGRELWVESGALDLN